MIMNDINHHKSTIYKSELGAPASSQASHGSIDVQELGTWDGYNMAINHSYALIFIILYTYNNIFIFIYIYIHIYICIYNFHINHQCDPEWYYLIVGGLIIPDQSVLDPSSSIEIYIIIYILPTIHSDSQSVHDRSQRLAMCSSQDQGKPMWSQCGLGRQKMLVRDWHLNYPKTYDRPRSLMMINSHSHYH